MDADDLTAYLARIGVERPSASDLASLAAIHWGHVSTIPFENLDILLGRRIAIDLPSIMAKLVRGGRGGYCFEQNALLGAALETLGFGVTRLSGRVRWLSTGISPRTHMLLDVEVPGETTRYLVDGGFGGTCPTAPIPLVDGALVTQHHDRYWLVAEGAGHVVKVATGEGWSDMYWFTREPQETIDYEVANHYTSTHPQSRFLQGLMCARTTAEGRVTVRGNELVRRRGQGGGVVEREVITDGEHLLAVLARELGVRFPSGTRFRHGPA